MAKKKYVAIHEVHLTVEPGKPGDKQKGIAPVKPKVKVIPPKTGFMADTDVGDELVAAGAAAESNEKVEATDEAKTHANKAPAKKAPAKKAAPKAAKDAAPGEGSGDGDEGGDGGDGGDGGSDDDANDLV